MGNLSSVTLDDSTFCVFAGGGGSAMPIHVELPKSASDSTHSGLAMLAWPDGRRYVYSTTSNSENTAFIPPEYMGVGSVYIRRAVQVISSVTRNPSSQGAVNSISASVVYDSVVGNSSDGATVNFSKLYSGSAGTTMWSNVDGSTSISFCVNPGVAP